MNRREFLQGVQLAAVCSAATIAFPTSSRGQSSPPLPQPSSSSTGPIASVAIAQIMNWPRFSKRHIEAPIYELIAWPGAVKYVAVIKRKNGEPLKVESNEPRLDLSSIWAKLPNDSFYVTVEVHGQKGVIATGETGKRVKAHDWAGYTGKPTDWSASADKNIAFLIDAAENAVAPYREPGVPVWVWSSAGPEPGKGHPQGRGDAYPAAQLPYFIWAFLAHAEAKRPQSNEALRLARTCGDWLLKHRNPDSGRLPLFPFSTIGGGKYEGGPEGKAINLMRASDTATGLVDLYRVTQEKKYLDYATHIADITMKFQRHDGSFPYRVDPASGQVVEDYTCRAIDFVKLIDALEAYRPNARRAYAARRAVDWMLAYPVATSHWQAAYEDVGEKIPFENLENAAALQLIRYLCRHHKENARYIPLARKVNRWVEDQFVVFKPDDSINDLQVPVPQVIEQYACWYIMETHTANWIDALIALHQTTGEKEYLEKAQAAANAICASQFLNGEFSTWGHDPVSGRRGDQHANWYVCNARASEVLYELDAYVASI